MLINIIIYIFIKFLLLCENKTQSHEGQSQHVTLFRFLSAKFLLVYIKGRYRFS